MKKMYNKFKKFLFKSFKIRVNELVFIVSGILFFDIYIFALFVALFLYKKLIK